MGKTPKYKAKHVYWDAGKQIVISEQEAKHWQQRNKGKRPDYIWRFDSQHEFKVYLELVRMFGADYVIRQYKVQIIPNCRCYPQGRFWRADFAIIGNRDLMSYRWLIEAKGALLPEFANILASLEVNDVNAFIRTFVIFDSKLPRGNRVIEALLKTSFNQHLLTFKELQQLKTLK